MSHVETRHCGPRIIYCRGACVRTGHDPCWTRRVSAGISTDSGHSYGRRHSLEAVRPSASGLTDRSWPVMTLHIRRDHGVAEPAVCGRISRCALKTRTPCGREALFLLRLERTPELVRERSELIGRRCVRTFGILAHFVGLLCIEQRLAAEADPPAQRIQFNDDDLDVAADGK